MGFRDTLGQSFRAEELGILTAGAVCCGFVFRVYGLGLRVSAFLATQLALFPGSCNGMAWKPGCQRFSESLRLEIIRGSYSDILGIYIYIYIEGQKGFRV